MKNFEELKKEILYVFETEKSSSETRNLRVATALRNVKQWIKT